MNVPRVVGVGEIQASLGPFEEIAPIGGPSGSGECWRVRVNGQIHVVKIIVREHEPGRFEREVAALGRLNSPRVMRVFHTGEIVTPAGRFPYLESEFVPGGSLFEHLRRGVPTDVDLRAFLLELLRGLAELDTSLIVHRDLKPENIILRDGNWGHPVVIDLGICRLVDQTPFTVYPWAMGTWPYMAPEQLRAERATHRSDIWAATVIAAEAAAGAHPFRRGERAPPPDWDQRLRAGVTIPGSRPAGLRDWALRAGNYRAYRRPTAARSIELLEGGW